ATRLHAEPADQPAHRPAGRSRTHHADHPATGVAGGCVHPPGSVVSTVGITVRPVSEELFDDVQTVFGNRGQAARCQCSSYRMGWYDQHSDNVQGRRELLKDQVIEGHGLLAYLDDEPAGWCSMAPRRDYKYLRQTAWKGRTEDKDDANIWA